MSSDHYDDCSPADIAGHRVFLGRDIDAAIASWGAP